MAFSIASNAFTHGGTIPRKYTCDSMNLSPPLAWSGVPAGMQSLLIVCNDPDAPGGTFHHSPAYNITADELGMEEGDASGKCMPATQAVNDFGHAHYDGPCPPHGHKPHAYHFRVSALNGSIEGVPAKSKCAEIIEHAKPLEIGAAEIVGYCGR